MSVVYKFAETVEIELRAHGAYALLIKLEETLRAKAGAKSALLAPGLYVYCGSAKGSGGIAARIGRHMRHGKRAHWHVDQLTSVGTALGPGFSWTAASARSTKNSPAGQFLSTVSAALIAGGAAPICVSGREGRRRRENGKARGGDKEGL